MPDENHNHTNGESVELKNPSDQTIRVTPANSRFVLHLREIVAASGLELVFGCSVFTLGLFELTAIFHLHPDRKWDRIAVALLAITTAVVGLVAVKTPSKYLGRLLFKLELFFAVTLTIVGLSCFAWCCMELQAHFSVSALALESQPTQDAVPDLNLPVIISVAVLCFLTVVAAMVSFIFSFRNIKPISFAPEFSSKRNRKTTL